MLAPVPAHQRGIEQADFAQPLRLEPVLHPLA
jgi:hypothetical protein